MVETLCLICYTNMAESKAKLKCGFKICAECFVNWVETKAGPGFVCEESTKFSPTIPCVNYECSKSDDSGSQFESHELTHKECLNFVCRSDNKNAYEKFTRCMLNIIAIQRRDYRKCPAQGCDYIGYVNMRASGDPLVCEKCDYKWEDPTLYPCFKRIYKGASNMLSLNSEILNNLTKIFSGEPCPNCGICITKLDGCDHMVCGKCGFEFCWLCLGGYPGYVHSEQTFCPLRKIVITMYILFFIIVTINFKFCIQFPRLRFYEKIMLETLMFLIISNLYGISILIEVLAISSAKENQELMIMFPQYASVYKNQYYIMLGVAITFPFVWFGGSILGYMFIPYFQRMVHFLIYEITIAFIAATIISCIIICTKICIGPSDDEAMMMHNDLNQEIISSYPSFEDDLLRSLPDFDAYNFEHYRNNPNDQNISLQEEQQLENFNQKLLNSYEEMPYPDQNYKLSYSVEYDEGVELFNIGEVGQDYHIHDHHENI